MAGTVARVICEEVTRKYGCSEKLLLDQGLTFKSWVLQLCKMYRCTKVGMTPYRPQWNGVCERWNQTLLRLLNKLPID